MKGRFISRRILFAVVLATTNHYPMGSRSSLISRTSFRPRVLFASSFQRFVFRRSTEAFQIGKRADLHLNCFQSGDKRYMPVAQTVTVEV